MKQFFFQKHFGRTAQELLEFTQVSYSNNVNPMPKLRKLASGKEISVVFSYNPISWSPSSGAMLTVVLQKGIAWLYCYSQETGFFTLQNKNPRFRFSEPIFLGGDGGVIYDELGQWIGHNRNFLEHSSGGNFTPAFLELFEEGWEEDGEAEFNEELQLWVSSFNQRRHSDSNGWTKYNLRVVSNQRQVLAFDCYRQEELQETRNKAWSQYSPLPDRGNILKKYLERVKDYEIKDGVFIPSYK